jgi:hypothetical protein
MKIALVASAMLVMSFTTGCYEVLKALGYKGRAPNMNYCVVCMLDSRWNCSSEAVKCYELDEAFNGTQCKQLNDKFPDYHHDVSTKPPGIKKCPKYQ